MDSLNQKTTETSFNAMSKPGSIPNHTQDPETGYLESLAYDDAFDATKKKIFIEAYRSKGLNLTETCKDLGMSKHTIYKHMRIDPIFNEHLQAAIDEYADKLEWVSRQNALQAKGFLDRAMQLRHLRPTKYAPEKISGPGEVVIKISKEAIEAAQKRIDVIDAQIVGEFEPKVADVSTPDATEKSENTASNG